ncbi:MAG: hypothetical protein AAF676_02130 [Pseudomonadota bacterium]
MHLHWIRDVNVAVTEAEQVFWNGRRNFEGVGAGEPKARMLEAASDAYEKRITELGIKSRSFNIYCQGHREGSLRPAYRSFLIGSPDPAMPQIARSLEALRRSLH